jgi:hypothetical protein
MTDSSIKIIAKKSIGEATATSRKQNKAKKML